MQGLSRRRRARASGAHRPTRDGPRVVARGTGPGASVEGLAAIRRREGFAGCGAARGGGGPARPRAERRLGPAVRAARRLAEATEHASASSASARCGRRRRGGNEGAARKGGDLRALDEHADRRSPPRRTTPTGCVAVVGGLGLASSTIGMAASLRRTS